MESSIREVTGSTDEPWLAAAARWPVAFARVREDPQVDLDALSLCGDGPLSVCMIASGGCTAAFLAVQPQVGSIHLVDVNPAQVALARIKLDLLQSEDHHCRIRLLGHRPAPAEETPASLRPIFRRLDIPDNTFGPLEDVVAIGLDNAGRYEALFARLAEVLSPHAAAIHDALCQEDVQARRFDPGTPLGAALDDALDQVMALPNLVRLFGEAATGNAVQPFSRHFAGRIRHALTAFPATRNRFLWEILLNRPCPVIFDWSGFPQIQDVSSVTWQVSEMDAALESQPGRFDYVHLSNILDWLSPADAARTLGLAFDALRPGGVVLIRQLNSSLDIPSLCPSFQWLPDIARQLHARDRSYFYRDLHLGRRP